MTVPSHSPALPIRWLLIFWIFLISAVAYLDRVNLSIAGRYIVKEFGLSYEQLGWISSAFLVGYALFQAPAGRLADRVGPRLILMLSVVWWAVFTVLLTLVPTTMTGAIFVLMLSRFCLGIGEAVMYPASNCVVSAWMPATERGRANGLIFAGVGFGAGVTAPLITYIMTHQGWRASFYVSAAIGLVAGGVWYWLARDRPEQHPWITPQERTFIQEGLRGTLTPVNKDGLPWKLILGNRNIWAVTFSYFAFGYAAQIFFTWFFIYLNDVRKLNLRDSALYTMLPFIAMSIGSISGGLISDRITKAYGKKIGRSGIAVFGIGLCGIFLALGTQAASGEMASVILAGGAGALYLSQSSFWSVTADVGGKSAGTVSGFMNMGGQFGGALTASSTPAIAHMYGWTTAFLVAAVLCILGSAAWLTLREAEPAAALQTAEL